MKAMNMLTTAGFVLAFFHGFAQGPQDALDKRRQDIRSMKVGFLTQRLDLTPEEAEAFWPVYNQYQDDRDQIRHSMKLNRDELRKAMDDKNDADVEKAVDAEMGFRQRELDLRKKYHAEFKKVLPIRKVALLYGSEDDFKRELLQRLQERREGKSGRRPPGGMR